MQKMTKPEFYDAINSIIKDELTFTKKFSSKIFALVIDASGNNLMTSTAIPDKNLTNMGDTVKAIVRTKQIIQEYPSKLLEDGKKPLAFLHAEILSTDTEKRINRIKVDFDDEGNSNVIEQKTFLIQGGEMVVDKDGDMVEGEIKLVEVEI